MDGMDKLKSILGDDAGEKIGAVLSGLTDESGADGGSALPARLSSGDASTLARIKGLVDQLGIGANDPRTALLTALKPYMSGNRRKTLESVIKLINLSKLTSLMDIK